MNLTLIPFFLAVSVINDDTSKWALGPEYTYDVNMTDIIRTDSMETIGLVKFFYTVICRPKISDSLLCYIQNATYESFLNNDNNTGQSDMTEFFEIKFDRKGVQSLKVETTPRNFLGAVSLYRDIANQFSLGVDIKEKIGTSQFTSRENTSMGNCETTYKMMREKPEQDTIQKEDTDIQFVVSPIVDEVSRTSFLTIEKSRMGCSNSSQYVEYIAEKFNMESFFSRIRFNGINSFETYSEKAGKLTQTDSKPFKVVRYTNILQVKLNSVMPAQDLLPLIDYDEPIDLNANSVVPNNLIN